jgi:hypothetical protein
VVFLEFCKQFVFLNSNKQNDGTTEREIRGRRGADLLGLVEGFLRFVVVRGALPPQGAHPQKTWFWPYNLNQRICGYVVLFWEGQPGHI